MPVVFFTITLMIEPIMLNIALGVAAAALIIYQIVHLMMDGQNYFGFT
jgi:hypothetical protein